MARHRYRTSLRWSDIDALRHVNNVQYLRFLEDARVAMLVEMGAMDDGMDLDVLVVRHEIDYRAPLQFRLTPPVATDLWVVRVGRSSFEIAYEVREEDADVVYADARSVIVRIDPATGRPTDLGAGLRALLESFVDDGSVLDGDAGAAARWVGTPTGRIAGHPS